MDNIEIKDDQVKKCKEACVTEFIDSVDTPIEEGMPN